MSILTLAFFSLFLHVLYRIINFNHMSKSRLHINQDLLLFLLLLLLKHLFKAAFWIFRDYSLDTISYGTTNIYIHTYICNMVILSTRYTYMIIHTCNESKVCREGDDNYNNCVGWNAYTEGLNFSCNCSLNSVFVCQFVFSLFFHTQKNSSRKTLDAKYFQHHYNVTGKNHAIFFGDNTGTGIKHMPS